MEKSRLHPRYIRRRIVLLTLLVLLVISGIGIAVKLLREHNNMLHSRFEESPDNEISNAWVTFAYSTPGNVIYLHTYDLDGNLLADLTDKLEVLALPHIFNCVQGVDGAPLYIVSYVKDNASNGLGILSSDGTDMTKGERYDAITYRDNIFCAVKHFGRVDEIKGPLNVLSSNEFNTRSETTYLDMNCNGDSRKIH